MCRLFFGSAKLDAVIGENHVDPVWNHFNQLVQECNCSGRIGLLIEPGERDLRDAVDGDKEVELAFPCVHHGDVDMEVNTYLLRQWMTPHDDRNNPGPHGGWYASALALDYLLPRMNLSTRSISVTSRQMDIMGFHDIVKRRTTDTEQLGCL